MTFNLITNRNTKSTVVMEVIMMAVVTVAAEAIEEYNMDIIRLCNLLQHNLSSLIITRLFLDRFGILLELRDHLVPLVPR